MNLIDDDFEPKKKKDTKKTTKIILAVIILLVIAIVAIIGIIAYMEEKTLKLYLNGSQNEKIKSMMSIDSDGTVYFPIKDIASYLGYQSFNGEYTDKSEEQSKCYIQNDNEVANFALNSNKIYKLLLQDSDGNYDYYYAKKPVKAINGKLYASSDAIEKAFNVSFSYNEEKQRAYIYTMPYLIQSYSSKVLDYGYEKISDDFNNQKTVLNDMLVVTKEQDKIYAVIDTKGNAVIEPKYDNIEYLPYSGDFLVTSNNKVGIISAKRETKIPISYDSLELIDSDSGLYLAERDKKYGVVDSNGNTKVYIEYDQIGVDNTQFKENNIKNKYLLDNGMIPAKKDKFWGAFDKTGKQVLNFEYDSFGYIASSNKDALNLLLIPDYNVMVVCKNKKYGLVNSNGDLLVDIILDDAYMTESAGKKYYYMTYNDRKIDIPDLLDKYAPTTNSGNNQNQTNTNNISNEANNEEIVENVTDQTSSDAVTEEQAQQSSSSVEGTTEQ